VTCFVLGSIVEQTENSDTTHWDGRVPIRPMSYDVFIRRAEKRMLGLRDKIRDAPFLRGQDIHFEAFIEASTFQPELNLSPAFAKQ